MNISRAFRRGANIIGISLGVLLGITGCTNHKTFEVPSGYELLSIEYPKGWKSWDHRHDYFQITEKARLSFNYNAPSRFVLLPDQAKLTPPLPTDSFGIYLGLIRCSAAAGRGYIYGCKDSESSPWPVPPIDPIAEGIGWDRDIRVINLETGNQLFARIDKGCEITKFCYFTVDFLSPTYRPNIAIKMGTVFAGGKQFDTPTLTFRWRDAYLR